MSAQKVDSDGFQQVSSKKSGPRRERRNALANIHEGSEERLTFADLKQQLSLLQKRMNSPKVDLMEAEETFVIRVEVPGLNLRDLRIDLQSNQFLLISGFKTETEVEVKRVVYKECRYGKFMRRVKLPALVRDFIFKRDVSLHSGVLTIILDKKNTGEVQLDSSLDDTLTPVQEEVIEVKSEVKSEVETPEVKSKVQPLSWANIVNETSSWADEI
jgi:HSP20 family protein